MQHPLGRCDCCGERLFATVDGQLACHDCGARYDRADESDGETGDGGRATPPCPRE